jgi:hypothetical protein
MIATSTAVMTDRSPPETPSDRPGRSAAAATPA